MNQHDELVKAVTELMVELKHTNQSVRIISKAGEKNAADIVDINKRLVEARGFSKGFIFALTGATGLVSAIIAVGGFVLTCKGLGVF